MQAGVNVLGRVAGLVLVIPILALVVKAFLPTADYSIWLHIRSTLLTEYLLNTLQLALLVSCGTLTLGVLSAWLITRYRFPGRAALKWLLICPLTIPAYIMAYVYSGLLDAVGPVQQGLRQLLPGLPPLAWASPLQASAAVLSLALFPYVYLLARAGFAQQSGRMQEAACMLGCSRLAQLFRMALPLARPAVTAGLLLALMETIADYGTVQYFGLPTLTTGIFRAWQGFGDGFTAVRLAVLLLGIAALLFVLEGLARRQARYYQHDIGQQRSIQLHGVRAVAATLSCALPALLGFLLPCGTLLMWALTTTRPEAMIVTLGNSLLLAGSASVLALVLSLLLLPMPSRRPPGTGYRTGLMLVRLGYAVPGTVVAISILVTVLWLEQHLSQVTGHTFSLLLGGGLAILIYAYLVRFWALAAGAVESGLSGIAPALGEVAHSLGLGPYNAVRRVHLPLLRGSLLAALLMVFAEVLKELPATLLLRPFNFNTLAIHAHDLANEGRIAEASWPALAIVLSSVIPLLVLGSLIDHVQHSKQPGS